MADSISQPPTNTTPRWRLFTRLLLALLFTVMASAIGLLLYDAYLDGSFSGIWVYSVEPLMFGLLAIEFMCLPLLTRWRITSRAKRRGQPIPAKQLQQVRALSRVQPWAGAPFLLFALVFLSPRLFDLPLVVCAMVCLIAALIILNLTNRWSRQDAGEAAAPGSGLAAAAYPVSAPAPSPVLSQQRISRRTAIVWIIGGAGALTAAIAFPVRTWLRPRVLFGDGGGIWTVAWSPDGSRIVTAGSKSLVYIINADTGRLLHTSAGHVNPHGVSGVNSAMWSPDGQQIVSASSITGVQVWDAATGTLRLSYASANEAPSAAAWSPNGRYIASGSYTGVAHIWDFITGVDIARYTLPPTSSRWGPTIYAVAWAPDSSRIAAACSDSTVRVIDAQTGKASLTYRGHTGSVACVAWSHDGSRIASGADTAQVWDATTGQRLVTYDGQPGGVSSVAWSPDSNQVASAGENDGTVQIWQATSGARTKTYRGHLNMLGLNGVNALAWSAKANMIASAGVDVQVWSPE